MNQIETAAASILAAQIESVDRICRYSQGREVNCYPRKAGSGAVNALFPNMSLDVPFARVTIETADGTMKAELIAVTGIFFSIAFDRKPVESFSIKKVEILANLMADAKTVGPEQVRMYPLTDSPEWFRQFNFPPATASPPLSTQDKAARLALIDSQMPTDYLQLLGYADGLSVPCASIMGLSEVRSTTHGLETYYLIGELPEVGMLGVQAGSKNGHVFLLRYDKVTEEYPSLEAVMKRRP